MRLRFALLVASAVAWGMRPAAGAPDGMPAALVVLADVESKPLAAARTYIGTVEAARRGRIDAEVAGYVSSVAFEAGDAVEKDFVLATLRTETLDVRLLEAEAQLALRREELRELEAGARPQEVDQARATLAAARADLAAAEWRLEAAAKLRARDRVTEDELRTAQQAVDTGKARVEGLAAGLSLLEEGARLERIAQARARIDVENAAIARLADERRRHEIRAPFAGTIVARLVEPGAWLPQGGSVAEVIDTTELDVVVPVVESDIAGLAEGLAVSVEIEALPGRLVWGKIHRILPVVDRRTRTLPIKVRLPARDDERGRLLRDGMFARVHLAVGEKLDVLVVPKDAIVLGGLSPTVYVVDPETMEPRPVPVSFGVADGDGIVVVGDLKAGDRVVVRGNERLRPGMKVRTADAR